jgi:hypothetical protein
MVPEVKSAQAKAGDGGRSGTPGKDEQEGSMTYTTENFVRRAVVGAGGRYRNVRGAEQWQIQMMNVTSCSATIGDSRRWSGVT